LLSSGVLRSSSFGGGRILLSLIVGFRQISLLLDQELSGSLEFCCLVGKSLGLGSMLSLLCFSDSQCLVLFCLLGCHVRCILSRLCSIEGSCGVDLCLDTANIFTVLSLVHHLLCFHLGQLSLMTGFLSC
jgi:hypothetical protein